MPIWIQKGYDYSNHPKTVHPNPGIIWLPHKFVSGNWMAWPLKNRTNDSISSMLSDYWSGNQTEKKKMVVRPFIFRTGNQIDLRLLSFIVQTILSGNRMVLDLLKSTSPVFRLLLYVTSPVFVFGWFNSGLRHGYCIGKCRYSHHPKIRLVWFSNGPKVF
jgi:hypothetical protein